jgi:hypothetical protein
MKQTAVEWLESKMPTVFKDLTINKQLIKQAKEIEKQQIFESWDNGFDNGNYYGKYNENCEINCGEQYYNETFKK